MDPNIEDTHRNKDRTFHDQQKVEETVKKCFLLEKFDIKDPENYNKDFEFDIEGHFSFAKQMILNMPSAYASIDAGLPWFTYWVLNILSICSIDTKNFDLSKGLKLKFVQYLKELQHPEGGFCGYNYGFPHIVSNYAAVMAIISLGIPEAYEIIDREKMRTFLKRMKNNNFENKLKRQGSKFDRSGSFLIEVSEDNKCSKYVTNWPGSFQMHINGESDLRATYCGLIVAYVLDILDDDLLNGVLEYIKQCQTFEGGLGPEPFCEAHGGYSFCGIAVLTLLNQLDQIDMPRFLQWIVNKQMSVEGGFQGRTNKLVDSCYSFWQGSVFNMLVMNKEDEKKYSYDAELLYDQLALQAYILFACQNNTGGLIDKPGRRPDLFHTNYASAGFSLSQYSTISDLKVMLSYSETMDLKDINPLFCLPTDLVEKAKSFYCKL